jgi:hypothetical protein
MKPEEGSREGQKTRGMRWALAASVIFGLAPGVVLLRQMMQDRLAPSGWLESASFTLCLPGIFLTPLPHMGLITFVMIIPMNMLFYFGLTLALIWFIRLCAQNC